jgi:hypothetical protein
MDASSQTVATVSTQLKAIHLYLVMHQLPVGAWIRKYGKKITYVIKFGMNPRRDTPTGDDAVASLE